MLNLKIITPQGTICSEQVEKISLPSVSGRFMVLKNHAPIIAMLDCGDVIYTTTDGKEHSCTIQDGFARVKDNNVYLTVELINR